MLQSSASPVFFEWLPHMRWQPYIIPHPSITNQIVIARLFSETAHMQIANRNEPILWSPINLILIVQNDILNAHVVASEWNNVLDASERRQQKFTRPFRHTSSCDCTPRKLRTHKIQHKTIKQMSLARRLIPIICSDNEISNTQLGIPYRSPPPPPKMKTVFHSPKN